MKDQDIWLKYTGKVAWPTIILFLSLLSGYILLCYLFKMEFSKVWIACSGAAMAYSMFTVAHEASHGNIAGGIQSFKKIENALGWVSSFFLLFPFSAFVVIHLQHHAHTNDPVKDPDNYVNGKNAFLVFFRCLTLIAHYFKLSLGKDSKRNITMKSVRSQSLFFLVFQLTSIGSIILIGEGELLFYVFILPALIAAPVLAFSFDWIPHYPHHNLGKYHNTRAITIPGLEFLSLYQSYHLMHHLYPRVPFYSYKNCFLDYENELRKEKSPIEGFGKYDLQLLRKKNTYFDLLDHKKWNYILEVENVFHETYDAIKIVFRNLDTIPFTYQSGQYVVISDYVNNRLVSRCYSICEDPLTGKLAVAVKRVTNGKLSNHLLDVTQSGYKLRVSGPYGQFVLPEVLQNPMLLIAGGSGITPVISILKTVLHTSNQQVTLLYGCNSAKDVIFEKEIEKLSKKHEDRLTYFLSYKILDIEEQSQYFNNISVNTQCYICGPKPMMEASKVVLSSIGIPEDQIYTEKFVYASNKLTGYTNHVEILNLNQTSFSVDTSETILEASIRNHKELSHACKMGQCGTCKVKLIEGEVVWQNRDEISLLQHEIDQGFILPCVCKPCTNLKLRV